ncbi:ribosome silencing factor [Gloeothece verrucosa]|uniref:Ribosomal silencing factor RsfS n=1 Tax=Gloeothece verrucosa (strain PCC 7822) TaxID=497965 RepID=E0UHG8_GLOV7|nr:ribosome silencing factor [Gloeothece verrucosa]ADN12109.1 iojap-like protein [Gloeothece verrucosa PCC 7822]
MTNTENYPLNNLLTLSFPTTEADKKTSRLAWTIAQAADDRKGADIVALDVSDVSYLSDYFIIVTGFSRTQVRAISDAIEEKAAIECNRYPSRTEGKSEGSWVLQDYGDVIVHIFLPEEREFYNLEAFWGHAKRFNLSEIDSLQE